MISTRNSVLPERREKVVASDGQKYIVPIRLNKEVTKKSLKTYWYSFFWNSLDYYKILTSLKRYNFIKVLQIVC